MLFLRF